MIAEPKSTGTNADIIQITGEGIPCFLISLPLKNMHTYNEICNLNDVEKTIGLIRNIMENTEGILL